MINPFKNQIGSTMIQVMVAGAALLGAGVFVAKTMKGQESLHKGTVIRSATSNQVKEISDLLSDFEICKATLGQSGSLTNEKLFTKIINKDNGIIFENGAELHAGTIREIRLIDFTNSGPGLRYSAANLRITMEFNERRASMSSVGGQAKSYKIPLYLITLDNEVQTCMSDSGNSIVEAMQLVCLQFRGTYNNVTGKCDNISGPSGSIRDYITNHFCSTTPGGCTHPYANDKCYDQPDLKGERHNNWAFKGFNASGEKICVCMPVPCPNPSNYCLGKDLGTNWCDKKCDPGSWDADDWSPHPSTVCSGTAFTQQTTCLKTRTSVGTYYPNDWTPSESTYCTTQSVSQTNSCGHPRTVMGTKTCL